MPDQGGLDQQVDTFNVNGNNLKAIATGFTNATEFTNRYGTDTGVTVAYLQSLYVNVLGRTGSSAEIQNWLNAVATPGSGYANRADVLFGFAQSSEFVADSNAGVVNFLTGAAQGQPVYTGSLQVNPGGGTVTNFSFTTGLDNLVGTSGTDTFTGDNTAAPTTVQAGDQITGGAGNDTFNYFGAAGAGATVLPQLNGVENIVFSAQQAAFTTENLSNVAGLQSVTIKSTDITGSVLTVASGVKVGLDTVGAGTTVAAETFVTSASATSINASVANGTKVTTLNLNGAALTTINLDSSGSAANVVTNLASTGTETTVNVTGGTKLTVGLADSVTTFNAAADTGGVTVTVGTSDITATGGSGNDKFVFAGTLTTADTVVGGAGTDTVSVTGADYSTVAAGGTLAALNSKVTGVEVLEFTGAAATTINGNTFTNTEVTKILFNTTAAGAIDTVDAAGSARTYAVGELNAGALTLNGKADVTSFNVSLEGITGNGGDVGAVTAAFTNNTASQVGTGTINLASIGTNDAANVNTTGVITGTSNGVALTNTNVVVTGSHDLTIGGLGTAGTINASAFTGKLIATGSTGQDFITGGSAADTINATVGGDSYTGGAGNDTFRFTNVNQGSSTALTTITDFTSGADKLALVGITNGTPVVNATAVNVSAAADFQGALNIAASGAGNANSIVDYFQFQGNTYVVVDNTAGGTFAATDAVIKLSGLVAPVANDFTFA